MKLIYLITGIIFLISLLINFKLKRNSKIKSGNVFFCLSLFILIGYILEIVIYLLSNTIGSSNIIIDIYKNLYYIFTISWYLILNTYIFIITNTKNTKLLYIIECIILIILSIIITLSKNSILVLAISILTINIVSLIQVILNHKIIKVIKSNSIYSILILLFVLTILQFKFTSVLVPTTIMLFITYLIYMYIESPSIKEYDIINELRVNALKKDMNKTNFLNNISHELRTPLTSIINSIEYMSMHTDNLSNEIKESINDLNDASSSLLDLVGNVIDINKIENKELELKEKNYDIRKEVERLILLNKKMSSKKDVVFKYSISENTPNVLYGDKTKIKEIINNLLTNAFKYTDKGTITLTINSVIENDICNLQIEVKDTGIGIKSEDLNKIFSKKGIDNDINSDVDRDGIGLLVSKDLIYLMNGTINVRSYYGSGSVFSIEIPQKISNVVDNNSNDNNITYDNKTILLVDDDELNNKVLSRLLSKYNIKLSTCKNGSECINKINNNEKYDLIFMDIMMKDMNGVDTLKELKNINNFNTKVIAFTADALTSSKDKYIKYGFDGYISKPFKKEDLEKILNDNLINNK